MVNLSKHIGVVIIILMIISGLLVFFILPNEMFGETFRTRTEIFLTIVIAFFAMMEGVSSYLQINDNRLRIRIDDLRNELEKAHGILFSIIEDMYHIDLGGITEEKVAYCFKHPEDKNKIDEIFRKYPFMFSQKLREFWINSIENIKPDETEEYTLKESTFNEFQNLVWEEYFNKLEEYRKLIGKDF